MVVGDIQGLDTNHGCLSLITNEHGGIMDDTVIVNAGTYVYVYYFLLQLR
jgi:aminomethyltransferase